MTEPREFTDKEAAQIVNNFDAAQLSSATQPYDRFVGYARADNGELLAVIRTQPDDNGSVSLVSRSSNQIETEIKQASNAAHNPGFYGVAAKRTGLSDAENSALHRNNIEVLEESGRYLESGKYHGVDAPPLNQALQTYSDPNYPAPTKDGDYAENPVVNSPPKYTGVVGIAQNNKGEPVALVKGTDREGQENVYAMTEEDLQQQVEHQSAGDPAFNDPVLYKHYQNDGQGSRLDAEDKVRAHHNNNRGVVHKAWEQMHEEMAEGEPLPTIEQKVTDYHAEQAAQPQPAAPQPQPTTAPEYTPPQP